MHKTMIALCGVAFLFMTGCTSQHLDIFPELRNPDLTDVKIAPEQLREDVDAFVSGIIERHPDVAAYAEIAAFHQQATRLKSSLTEPLTRVEFFRKVGALSHLFNDGHTFLIWPYQEYQHLKENGALVFPFALDIFSDGVYIKYDYFFKDQQLPKGAKLLSINNMDIFDIFADAQEYVGGETDILRKHVVAERFPVMLWAMYGITDAFTLKVDISGQQHVLHVDAKTDWKKNDALENNENSDFEYQLLNKETGYLKIATFDVSPDWFENYIDQTFQTIKQQKIKHLIIDIRENGGGNTDTSTYLAQHIASSPFRMISSMRERLNTDNRGLFNYRGEVGEVLQEDWNDWVAPADEETRFTGNTYVLISPLSYSSAIVFATAVQDNNLATLVGRETGGYANQTAQGNLFNLPNSELRVYVATRLLVRPSGSLRVGGVVPDIRVEATYEQITAGIDADIKASIEHTTHVTGLK